MGGLLAALDRGRPGVGIPLVLRTPLGVGIPLKRGVVERAVGVCGAYDISPNFRNLFRGLGCGELIGCLASVFSAEILNIAPENTLN